MKLKPIITEVIILIVIYIATRLSIPFLTASWGGNATLDINFHDTYFVVNRSVTNIPAFLLLATLVYLIKEAFYHYKRRLQNLILVISNFLFLIVLYPFSSLLNIIPKPGWTIYPPLSALPKGINPVYDQDTNTLYFY